MNTKAKLLSYSALMCAMIIISTLWFKFTLPGLEILFTTQVFFILLCGQILPSAYCFYAIGAYLALGLCGLPVFSATQGLAVIATPTFGYLLAFPFSAATVACLRKWLRNRKGARWWASAGGLLVMYVISLSYIAALKALYLNAPVPLPILLGSYCLAFLPMDLIKGAFAALLGDRLQKALRLPNR